MSGRSSSKPASTVDETERLAEIAEILAIGLSRLEARKSSRKSADFGESSLHFTPERERFEPGVRSRAPEAAQSNNRPQLVGTMPFGKRRVLLSQRWHGDSP